MLQPVKLQIDIGERVYIELPFHSKIQVLSGDSGAGKTYTCEMIRLIQNLELDNTLNIEADSIVVIDRHNQLNEIVDNKYIIIDRFDYIMTTKHREKFIEQILKSDSRFLLITHTNLPPQLDSLVDTALDYVLRVNKQGDKLSLTTKPWIECEDILANYGLKHITMQDLFG